MASHLFAMEALALTAWRMADQHTYDVRIEAALAKLFCSEKTIQFLKDREMRLSGGWDMKRPILKRLQWRARVRHRTTGSRCGDVPHRRRSD